MQSAVLEEAASNQLSRIEMFRVLGKRRPKFVKPYLELLQKIATTDTNHVVKIHCQGAIKATSNLRLPRSNPS